MPPLKPWQRLAVLFAAGVALGAIVWWPMFRPGGAPTVDGRYFLFQIDSAKASFRQYGELPFWNPFDCAGIPAWDHPEAIIASPLVLLLTPLGVAATMAVWQLWHIAFGFVGMWLLCRDDLKLSRLASTLAACVFAAGPWFAGQGAGMHATMMSFEYVPLLFFVWRRAEASRSWAIGAGALVALMIFDGATYPLPFCLLALAAETLTRLTDRTRARAIVTHGLLSVVTAIGLAGVRLLPLISRLGQGSRGEGKGDHDTVAQLTLLWKMFTWRETSTTPIFWTFQWHEYIAYLGLVGLALALIGLIVAAREARWTVVVAALVFVLMLGVFADWAPWALLRAHVPPFGSMRVAARFRHILVMFTCLWTALAVDRVPPALGRLFKTPRAARLARIGLVGLALYAAEDELLFASRVVGHHYEGAPLQPVVASPRFSSGGEGLAPDWIDQPSQNRAYTGCRAEWAFRGDAAIWTGDVPQARAADDAVLVESSSRTHSTFEVVVVAARPGRILLNSAYDPGWRTSVGTTANQGELLAVDVPAGRSVVHARYVPKHILLGLLLTLATALAIGLYFGVARRPASVPAPQAR
ncbi:hypothetical protein BH11MYX4_BH11MYX4_04680 [soil metagenome]